MSAKIQKIPRGAPPNAVGRSKGDRESPPFTIFFAVSAEALRHPLHQPLSLKELDSLKVGAEVEVGSAYCLRLTSQTPFKISGTILYALKMNVKPTPTINSQKAKSV